MCAQSVKAGLKWLLLGLLLPFASTDLPAQSPTNAAKVIGYFAEWGVYAQNFHVPTITMSSLAFDAPYTVQWIYHAIYGTVNSPPHTGNHYTVTSGWVSSPILPPGGSLELQFQGTPGGGPPAPGNIAINGVLLGACNPAGYAAWAGTMFGCTNCPQALASADPDGDGRSNLEEFMADTNPTNAASNLHFTGIRIESGALRLEWEGGILATQVLQRCAATGTNPAWMDIWSNLPPTSPTNAAPLTPFKPDAAGLFRVKVLR